MDDRKKIVVINHKPTDSFGHEVTVSAPSQMWEKGQQALTRLRAEL